MGWHDCPKPDTGYIHGLSRPIGNPQSSGDWEITFDSGRTWRFPDALIYYIEDCGYKPPQLFIDDILTQKVTDSHRWQTRSVAPVCLSDEFTVEAGGNIGYLSQEEVNRTALAPWQKEEGSQAQQVLGKLQSAMGLDRGAVISEDFLRVLRKIRPSGME